ncbi:hypothetical protein F4821DRAFT_223349 [Hypoxylon rubiginosum]|uniref:Uncharacterized protein n=1 Tax=Hypoxylon rubiginosum TaxID=110542 RepID=A0ACC0DK81_9PEZI|nr:hypothetical protein F4821DRAFT_223349 [Hypoxylon rubiginosum]
MLPNKPSQLCQTQPKLVQSSHTIQTREMTTRLRRTFAYPTDDNDDASSSSSAALDEQEQETLIEALAEQNDVRNAQFRLLLLCLPAVSALPYVITLLFGGASRSSRFVALMSLSSLASTGWMLARLPPGVTGIKVLDEWVGANSNSDESGSGSEDSKQKKKKRAGALPFWADDHPRSPLENYLPYLNTGLCAVLVLTGFLSRSAVSQGYWGHVGLSNLPAIVYGVVLVAKLVMGGVDPERDLDALRYEYKGA